MPNWASLSNLSLEDVGMLLLALALVGIGFCLGYGARIYITYRRRYGGRPRPNKFR